MWGILVTLARLGVMQGVMALTSLVRNKVVALELGAQGLGDFSQIFLLASTLSVIITFGLDLGLNRNVAAAPDHAGRQLLLNQSNTTILALGLPLLVGIFAMLAMQPETMLLLGVANTPVILAALAILVLGAPLDAAVRHRIAFLTAALDIKGMTTGRSIALVTATVLSIPIVFYFGLVGAAIQVMLVHTVSVLLLDRRCRQIGYRAWGFAARWSTFRSLAMFGAASLVLGFTQQFADLMVRAELMRSHGAAENGVFQAAMSILNQLSAIILGSIGSYAIAKMSSDTSRSGIAETANRLLSVVLPVGAVAFAGIGLLSAPAIIILYSRDFLAAQLLMPYMLVAELMLVAVWVLGAPLLAESRLGLWMTVGLLSIAVRTIAGLLLIPTFSATGLAIAYLVGTGFHLAVYAWIYVAAGFALNGRSVLLFVSGIGLVCGLSIAGAEVVFDWPVYAGGIVVIVAFALVSVHFVMGIPTAWAMLRHGVGRGDA